MVHLGRAEHVTFENAPSAYLLLPEGEGSSPSLADEQLAALAEAGLAIDGYFGGAQDVEWAFDAQGKLVILQARPLRTEQVKVTGERAPDDAVVLLEGGQPVWVGRAVGRAFTVSSPEALDSVPEGSLLVLPRPMSDAFRVLPRVCGVVVEHGSVTSHMASVLREFRVPSGMLMATWTCRSLHDVVRFAHEMAIQSMFDNSDDLSRARLGGVKTLESTQSFPVHLIDLGGGVAPPTGSACSASPPWPRCSGTTTSPCPSAATCSTPGSAASTSRPASGRWSRSAACCASATGWTC